MALFTPSASPAVTVKEIDLTGVVPNVQTSTGAFVGEFGWGPVGLATLVSDESGLVSTFSSPDSANTVDFHSAAYFLRYSNSLQVVRAVDGAAKNATANHDVLGSLTPNTINTVDAFDDLSLDSSDGAFIAKYPGKLGNGLKVSVCAPIGNEAASGQTNFDAWAYKQHFDAAPGTSQWLKGISSSGVNDEMHIIVLDGTGEITGTPDTVLETFPFVSAARNAKSGDGTPNFFKEVLKNTSSWVYAGDFHLNDSDSVTDVGSEFWGTTATPTNFVFGSNGIGTDGYAERQDEWTFHSGNNGGVIGSAEYNTGFDNFNDKDNIEVDFLITPESLTDTEAKSVVNNAVAIAEGQRKDCVVVASPSRAAVVTTGTNTAVLTCNNEYTKSSYLVQDNNYVKVFDKYNDQYIKIPASSSTAGLMAATDLVAAPWFSPAGARRGRYLGITDIVLSPTKVERDTLYKAGINPIANIPGEGIMLFGDKTNESRPSAFDRINVRRLFLAIERAIGIAGRNVMFEFNDEFTRAEFVNIVEPFLREIQGRRGITDFRVICDASNNPASVVDRNEFIASIFIKPARSINYVTLNFVAVRTGVEFEEVVGTV